MRYTNNPLNIRYAVANRWKGLLGSNNGFCSFYSMEYGFRAAWLILRSYRKRGLKTINDIIKVWAPPFENPTFKYIDFVSSKMALFPWDELKSEFDYVKLVYFMAWFEQGTIEELPSLKVLSDMKRKSGVAVIV